MSSAQISWFDPVHTGLDPLALEAESLDGLRAWATWLDTCPDRIQIEFTYLDLAAALANARY